MTIPQELLAGCFKEYGAIYQAFLARNLRDVGCWHIDPDSRGRPARTPVLTVRRG